MISLHQSLRIGDARSGIGLDGVDVVPAVGRQLYSVDCLGILGAWLGVLAGHTTYTNDGDARAPREDEAHLQKNLQLCLDGGLGAVGKPFSTVAALEEELLALGRLGQVCAEGIDLAVVDQRWQRAHFIQGSLQRGRIRVVGLLADG